MYAPACCIRVPETVRSPLPDIVSVWIQSHLIRGSMAFASSQGSSTCRYTDLSSGLKSCRKHVDTPIFALRRGRMLASHQGTRAMTKFGFKIRTRSGLVVDNLLIPGKDQADAERKLNQ